ncbi:hypothetical protein ACFSTH_00835 [Paenibacillus yanchengensis]
MERSIAQEVYADKEMVHYQMACLDHIIDIISFDVPIIVEKSNL